MHPTEMPVFQLFVGLLLAMLITVETMTTTVSSTHAMNKTFPINPVLLAILLPTLYNAYDLLST